MRRSLLAVLVPLLLAPAAARAQVTSISLSHDPVSLGIASQNVTPDMPALDASPLVAAAVQWAMPNGVSRITADRGSYYVLTRGVDLRQVHDLTLDYAGAPATFDLTNTLSDTTVPTIAITSPTGHATWTTGLSAVVLQGAATDDVGVTRVTWMTDRSTGGVATGTTNWSTASIPLLNGANLITVVAYDAAGNTGTASITVTRDAAALAAMTSPADGSTLSAGPVTFAWSAGTGVTAYHLSVGTTGVGSTNLFDQDEGTAHSQLVGNLPTNGSTVYVRLSSMLDGTWQARDYRYRASGTGARPVATYTPIYTDDIETMTGTVAPAFEIASAGATTTNSAEVISGARSVKGSYFGSERYHAYFRTNPSTLHLTGGRTYSATFRYRIVTAPSQGFDVLFYSPTGGAAGVWLPSITISGSAGDTGTRTLTNTLGPYSDYEAHWSINGTGSIVIDDVTITDDAGNVVAAEGFEAMTPGLGAGLQLLWSADQASPVTDPSLVLNGQASVRLRNYGRLSTVPLGLPLAAGTTYVVEFTYRIVSSGTGDSVVGVSMLPEGPIAPERYVQMAALLKNAPEQGTFSSGALTSTEASWVLSIAAMQDSDVIVDDLTVYRQDTVWSDPDWTYLKSAPFPRLGDWVKDPAYWIARWGSVDNPPLGYTVDEIENGIAFSDLDVSINLNVQTQLPDTIRRLRMLNPRSTILTFMNFQEVNVPWTIAPSGMTDLDHDFATGVADAWYLRDSHGQIVEDAAYPFLYKPNITEFCPVVNGATWRSYVVDFIANRVAPSGLWDGLWTDNLFAAVNAHIPNRFDPDHFDADYNGNGVRDETPAAVTDMVRKETRRLLTELRGRVGDNFLLMGNTGSIPELTLAPYVNGYVQECVNNHWQPSAAAAPQEDRWRQVFDQYRAMVATSRRPTAAMLEGCGRPFRAAAGDSPSITADDARAHRLVLGTTLLDDGFYDYDRWAQWGAPHWFDEFSVDASGTALRDRTKRGYLGQGVSRAVELTDGGISMLHEDFEGSSPPVTLDPNAYITHMAAELVSGTGNLVLNNPNHATSGRVAAQTAPMALAAGQYVLTYDWRILETIDTVFDAQVQGANGLLLYQHALGLGAGDAGTAVVPFTTPNAGPWTLVFVLYAGGGKVAIDNVRLVRGGVGPWRRDFENGFVLVNPLNTPHTFSAAELAGTLGRTGIHRIRGTQAPDVNTGQPVTGELTLAPFDAIILLADHVAAPANPAPGTFGKIGPTQWATGQGAAVTVSWAESVGAASYEYCVDTTDNGACDGTWTTTGATSAAASGLELGRQYFWQVRARNGGGTTEAVDGWWSFRTAATSGPTFTDDPLVAGTTAVKVTHITELRDAIAALRSRYALTAFPWTDPTLTAATTPVKAVHLAEMRTALAEVYSSASRMAPTYTTSILTPGTTVIRAVDIAELRAAVLAIW